MCSPSPSPFYPLTGINLHVEAHALDDDVGGRVKGLRPLAAPFAVLVAAATPTRATTAPSTAVAALFAAGRVRVCLLLLHLLDLVVDLSDLFVHQVVRLLRELHFLLAEVLRLRVQNVHLFHLLLFLLRREGFCPGEVLVDHGISLPDNKSKSRKQGDSGWRHNNNGSQQQEDEEDRRSCLEGKIQTGKVDGEADDHPDDEAHPGEPVEVDDEGDVEENGEHREEGHKGHLVAQRLAVLLVLRHDPHHQNEKGGQQTEEEGDQLVVDALREFTGEAEENGEEDDEEDGHRDERVVEEAVQTAQQHFAVDHFLLFAGIFGSGSNSSSGGRFIGFNVRRQDRGGGRCSGCRCSVVTATFTS
ncbi:hypothetical protein TYRP_002524 [Tyrophagus putrescentiae]|nr:hypothetical protein TYRP_002524 [Tyrophagus putrescentiae]